MKETRVLLFGMQFISAHTIFDVADKIFADLQEPGIAYDTLITPNAYITVVLSEPQNRWLKDFFAASRYVLPDGTPIVWLSKLKYKYGLEARLTGSDLFPVLWEKVKQQSLSATFILANQDLCKRFSAEYKNCRCLVPAFFDFTDDPYILDFARQTADEIVASNSSFVFLGITTPKQEKIAYYVIKELEQRKYAKRVLLCLLGASYEFYFDLKPRAPKLFQKTGFEWLYRLLREPRRLWRRYTVDNMRFIALAVCELIK